METGKTVLMHAVVILLFLLINPLIAVFLLGLLGVYRRVPVVTFILLASVSFACFFYFREYGINWFPDSVDDGPRYIALYEGNEGLSFGDLLLQTLGEPNGYEPLWHIPAWFLINGFGASNETFLFLHYLVIFLTVFTAIATFSRRFLVPFVVVYLFLMPISIDSMAHIWRQQLAFTIFLAGVGLHAVRGSRAGKWLIFLSVFMHVSSLFFVAAFVAFEWLRKHGAFRNKLKFSIVLALVMAAIPPISGFAVGYLDALGLSKIMSYFEAYGADPMRGYIIIAVYALPMLFAFYVLRNDDTNCLFMILCFAVFSIVLAFPAASGMFERLLMYALPFLSFFLFRCFLLNAPARWTPLLLTFAFATGMYRLYAPTREGSGTMAFLAFGHAFDPFMGLVKLLVTF